MKLTLQFKKVILLLSFVCYLNFLSHAQSDQFTAQVTFPANYQVGDYIEFVAVAPISAGASGYYELSISYTRGNLAAAATYLGSISHGNPSIWRELGRVNSNGYVTPGSENHCFTIDCNSFQGNPRFRIRAIRIMGVLTDPLSVFIKVRAINQNNGWTPLNSTGTDINSMGFLPMTNDWSLYVGNSQITNGAHLAIKAIENGNVGIGTSMPTEKLSVKGKIRAQEIKIENTNWPDFVFKKDYKLTPLSVTENYIRKQGHLSGIPSAKDVLANGVSLGQMNANLLQKIEEITLYLIQQNKKLEQQSRQLHFQGKKIKTLERMIVKRSSTPY